jgi:dolichyl-phosphate beta-glucosyltransferase
MSRGKGYALLTGIEAASGEIVLTADADLAVEPDQFESLIAASSAGSIAIASRSVDGAKRIDEPLMRYVLGRAFNALVRWLVLPGIRDSQCGFKAFHRDPIRSVLADARTGGWVFDVEFLALARRHGFSIKEIPVRWFYRHGSTVRPLRDAPGVISELWRLRRTVGRVHGR